MEEENSEIILIQLEDLRRKIEEVKTSIQKLETKEGIKKEEEIIEIEEEDEEIEEENDDEYQFYLENYRLLREDFTKKEMKEILPRRKNKNYKNILIRLSIESIKEIKELEEMRELSEKEEQEEIEDLIQLELKKIKMIQERLKKKEVKEEIEEIEEQEEKNEIILVPTISGNIRLLDEIEHIPKEYYEGFKELIDSIIDGTFKNIKCLTKNKILNGLYEVKLFKIRVVFKRIKDNKYALITAFVKKSNRDKLYLESLRSKIFDYKQMEKKIKELIENDSFLEENEKAVIELYNQLERKEEMDYESSRNR